MIVDALATREAETEPGLARQVEGVFVDPELLGVADARILPGEVVALEPRPGEQRLAPEPLVREQVEQVRAVAGPDDGPVEGARVSRIEGRLSLIHI